MNKLNQFIIIAVSLAFLSTESWASGRYSTYVAPGNVPYGSNPFAACILKKSVAWVKLITTADRELFAATNPRLSSAQPNLSPTSEMSFSTAVGGGSRVEGLILVRTANATPWVWTIAENSDYALTTDSVASSVIVEFSIRPGYQIDYATKIDISEFL